MFSLRRRPRPPAPPIPEEIEGIRVKRHALARRMSLRVDARSGEIILTWAPRTTENSARRFIIQNRKWIEAQKSKMPVRRDFMPGETLKIRGKAYTLRHVSGRGLTHFEGKEIVVYGATPYFARRVRDFLKAEALVFLTALSDKTAAKINLPPAPVRVADPKTRWGSCGNGSLMYSWRLILAPPQVAAYIVAHEVAHRVHMNHGRRFWKLCEKLAPQTEDARQWLKDSGPLLMIWI